MESPTGEIASAVAGRGSIVDYARSSSTYDSTSRQPIPNSGTLEAELLNGRILNETLQSLLPGQTLHIDGTYHLMGGIVAYNLKNITIILDGTLKFSKRTRQWPTSSRQRDGRTVLECIHLIEPKHIILTSSYSLPDGGGILDGSGAAWWGLPFIGYARHQEDRPRLLRVTQGENVVMEKWLLLNSPYWATLFEFMNGLTIRYVGIVARRTSSEGHSLLDLSAFNTDGLDVSGRNVHVHDCNIRTQDDIIAVKDGPVVHDDHFFPDQETKISENMLFERINGTGLGLTIGSIGNWSHVRNVTFRHCYLPRSYKGIYLKFNRKSRNASLIEDVLFEDIVLDEPEQYPIWIGPAQQADSVNICRANPCSLCWPLLPGTKCKGETNGTYSKIVLRNIRVTRPKQGGGVIMGAGSNPMKEIVFDGVKVNACGPLHYEGAIDDSFPLLPSTVPVDVHIQGFRIMLFVGAILVIWTAKRALSWALSRKFCHPLRVRGRTERAAALAACAGILVLCPTIWFVYITLKIRRPNQYFVCEGADGIALGDTNPVPHCFEDRTNQAQTVPMLCPDLIWHDPVFGSALYGLSVSALCAMPVVYICFVRRKDAVFNSVEMAQLFNGPSEDGAHAD